MNTIGKFTDFPSDPTFQNDILQITEKFNEYTQAKKKTELNAKKLTKLNTNIKNITADLNKKKAGVFGSFVTLITFEYKILSIITDLFCKIFPSIKTEIEARKKIELKITKSTEEKKQTALEGDRLKENEEALLNSHKKLAKDYRVKREKKITFEKMMSLFGGEIEYLKLPILDISTFEEDNDYIDYIKPTDMSAPIMRGQDSLGRQFFTIRYKKLNKLHTQTFFERYTNGAAWANGRYGRELLETGHIISEDYLDEKAFTELAIAIQQKSLNGAVIE